MIIITRSKYPAHMVENLSLNSRSTTAAIQNMHDTDSKWWLVPLAQFQLVGSWWSSMTAISHMYTSQFKYTDCSAGPPDLEELTKPHNSASHSQHNPMPLILYNHFGQRLAQSVRKCYWKRRKESRKGLSNFDRIIIRVSTDNRSGAAPTAHPRFQLCWNNRKLEISWPKAWSKSQLEHVVLVLPTNQKRMRQGTHEEVVVHERAGLPRQHLRPRLPLLPTHL
jgi:hypothetical protein